MDFAVSFRKYSDFTTSINKITKYGMHLRNAANLKILQFFGINILENSTYFQGLET